MKGIILLDANENTKSVEEEEKSTFIKHILENIGLPIQEIWDDKYINLSTEDQIKLRGILATFNVSIINDIDGGLKVYVDKDMIGEWRKPTYVLKRDYSQINPKKYLYLEMHIDPWSIFENADG